jgi:hypothetical protein
MAGSKSAIATLIQWMSLVTYFEMQLLLQDWEVFPSRTA